MNGLRGCDRNLFREMLSQVFGSPQSDSPHISFRSVNLIPVPSGTAPCAGDSPSTSAVMAKGKRPVAGGGGGNRGETKTNASGDPAHTVKVEMSARSEERIRRALQGVSLDAVVTSNLPELTEAKLRRAYDGLLARGFGAADVEAALAFVANMPTDSDSCMPSADTGAGAVETEALDWLCFTLDTEKLPRRYQGGVRSAAAAPGSAENTVQVLRTGRADKAWDDDEIVDDEESAAKIGRAERSAAEAKAKAATEAKKKAEAEQARKAKEAEQAAKANREWIMSQYENASDDDGSSYDSDGSSHDSLEDFGLPPEEIERRAWVRRRKRSYENDPGAHIVTMRIERDTARSVAAEAKQSRDKSKQKTAGAALKKLIDELTSYGLTQDDLDAPAEVEEDDDFAFGYETTDTATVTGDENKDTALDGTGNDTLVTSKQPKPETKTEPSSAKEKEESDSDDDGFGLDLFETDGDTVKMMGESAANELDLFELIVSPLFPPMQIAAPSTVVTGKKGKKHESKSQKSQPEISTLQPKALLQMLCRSEGWIAPRYDKITDSGVAGTHYSVVVERNIGDKKKAKTSAANRAALQSTVTSRWPEFDLPSAGWLSVNDAQNAAACRGLFDVFSSVSSSKAVSGRGLPVDPNKANIEIKPGVAFAPQELDDLFLQPWRRWAEDNHVAECEACASTDGGTTASGPDARDTFVSGLMKKRRFRDGSAKKTNTSRTENKQQNENENFDSWEDVGDALDAVKLGASGGKDCDTSRAHHDDNKQHPKDSSLLSKRLLDDANHKSTTDGKWRDMWSFRKMLPVYKLRKELLDALSGNNSNSDAAVVCGETGSGKTTQVPQYLLDDAIERGEGAACRVVCTQPRRVAALSVAERVSQERCERSGVGGTGSLVGHHVRLDAKVTKDTRLTFMTAGILLRKMHGDPLLSDISHVVLDEIHERSLDGDLLLALLRDVPRKRRELKMPPLKLVVMSATLNAELFCGYLGGCPVISAPGRTHPVQTIHLEQIHDLTQYALDEDSRCCRRPMGKSIGDEALNRMRNKGDQNSAMDNWGTDGESQWAGDENPDFDAGYYECLEDDDITDNKSANKYAPCGLTLRNLSRLDEAQIDYDLIERLILYVDNSEPRDGAFLVFLPGIGEVSRLIDRLSGHPQLTTRHGRHKLVPLHSALTPQEQREAFKIPKNGVRKIVVATNVAETSVTIPDIVVVVDSGRVKERQWDPKRGMASLDEGWVSRASARQRAGRAGRVRPGKCYAMFTHKRATHQMRHHQVPELHRVPLTEVVLQIKKLGVGGLSGSGSGDAAAFLAQALEPPAPLAVAAAVSTLREIGALQALKTKTKIEEIDGGGSLTPLGHHLASLPVDCRVAKMLVYGALFSCVSPTLTIAACLSYKSPFVDNRSSNANAAGASGDSARHALAKPNAGGLAAGEQSDHLVYAEAYYRWSKVVDEAEKKGGKSNSRDVSRRHCQKNGLSMETLKQIAEMRGQYASLLFDTGLIVTGTHTNDKSIGRASSAPRGWVDDSYSTWNVDSNKPAIVKAVIAAGLYANVAAIDDETKNKSFSKGSDNLSWRDSKGPLGIHNASVNSKLVGGVVGASVLSQSTMNTSPLSPFLTYHEKVKTHKVFVRECTIVPPAALLLFGGDAEVKHELGKVCLDGWLWLKASAQTAAVFRRLRAALDLELEQRIANARGGKGRKVNEKGNEVSVVSAIRALLSEKN